MNYSDKTDSVRVDFFKESGKWYTTEAIIWPEYEGGCLQDILREALRIQLKGRLSGMWAVCLEPYHEHSHPIMIKVP